MYGKMMMCFAVAQDSPAMAKKWPVPLADWGIVYGFERFAHPTPAFGNFDERNASPF
jgi:hypothetical protein